MAERYRPISSIELSEYAECVFDSVLALSLVMRKQPYRVASGFTVFRQRDEAPKHLKPGSLVVAREPLGDPVILEIGADSFESDRGGFLAHTVPGGNEEAGA